MADPLFKDSQQIANELELLIKQIDQLKSMYDLFFQGVKKEEPFRLRNEVQDKVRKLSGVSIQNAGIKFKLNQTISRYNTFNQHWNRILKDIEEGRHKRDLFLAKLHEKERGIQDTNPQKTQTKKQATTPNDQEILFQSFLKARKDCGEPVQGITKEKFEQTLTQQREALKAKIPEGKTLQFKVVIENGKSKLKAFV